MTGEVPPDIIYEVSIFLRFFLDVVLIVDILLIFVLPKATYQSPFISKCKQNDLQPLVL